MATLRAILFDWNGVVVDDEPIHCRLAREVLAGERIELSEGDYFARYLPFNDQDLFAAVLRDRKRPPDPAKVGALCRKKEALYAGLLPDGIPLVPGADEMVRSAARRYRVAVVSGALRSEIRAILDARGLAGSVHAVVAAEDVAKGKPDPEPYRRGIEALNAAAPRPEPPLRPEDCLAVEDAPGGVAAARAAGLRVLAFTTSASAAAVGKATLVLPGPAEVRWEVLETRLAGRT
ncbi:MAG: HAD family phosphatase [Planctomycetales bacterium]|nr:HAD family phosphatase [Planctomycetales bacterium]